MSVRKFEMVNGRLVQVSGPPEDQAALRRKFEDIVESKQGPGLSTDSTFFSGAGTLDRQFGKDKQALQEVVTGAKRSGFRPTGNELYQPSLARFPGDPRAFISQADGKAKVRKIVEETGTGCEGAITVKAREPEQEPQVKHKLAPQIVRRHLREKLKNPDNARRDRRELVEQIVHEHGPPA